MHGRVMFSNDGRGNGGTPLRALIKPEEWPNIPPCLVRAWKDAIEQHDRLLEVVARLAGS